MPGTQLPNYQITQLPNSLSKHVLDAIEEVPLVLSLFGSRSWLELLDDLALLLRELAGDGDLHGRKQVAAAAAAHLGHPLAAQAQGRAGLRAFRHLDVLGAVERRHLNLAAELPKEAFAPRPRDAEQDERNLFDRVKDMFG